jgi:peptidoglycan/xylan/chitin deacetylase (PgdA/CDA1 family)
MEPKKTRTLVLCYHAVSEDWPSPLAVHPDQLERQLVSLLARGYEGVTFSEAVLDGGNKPLAVTFDDAYRSVIELALPILSRLGIPGTVFAPTAHIGLPVPRGWDGTDHWLNTPWAGELMHASWEELKTLHLSGWEIGSHTCTHPHLPGIDDTALMVELEESRGECEKRLGIDCRSLAYPYGEVDDRVRDAAAAAGFETAASLGGRLPRPDLADRLRWPRLGVYGDSSDLMMAWKRWLFRRSPSAWNAAQAVRRRPRRASRPNP